MSYIETLWQNEEGTLLNRFSKSSETVTDVILTRNPATITRVGTVFSTANMNKIENALGDVFNNAVAFDGVKTFNDRLIIGGVDSLVGLLQVGVNSNVGLAEIGYGALGYAGLSNIFYIAHRDQMNTSDFGILMANTGTVLNAKAGDTVFVRTGNISKIIVTDDDISLLKPVTVSTTTGNEADFSLVSGTAETKLFYRDTDHEFGIFHYNGSVFSTRFRLNTNYTTIGESSAYRVVIGTPSDNLIDFLQVGYDSNNGLASIGYGRLGYAGVTNSFYVAHIDNMNVTDFSLRCTTGDTLLNAKVGSRVVIQNGGSGGDNIALFEGASITMYKPLSVEAENSKVFVNAAQYLTFGSSFAEANARYRMWYDGANTDFRFDTSSVSLNHVFGSYNAGGTLLSHMVLTGAGRLVLGGSDNLTDLMQVAGSLYASGGIKTDNVTLKTKIVDIGTWDMDTNQFIGITHGASNIKSVEVTIYRDTGNITSSIFHEATSSDSNTHGYWYLTTSGTLTLYRVAGIGFDNTNYSGSSNRGHVVITYEA